MLKKMFLIVVIIPLITFAQEKKFSSFELLYDIPQQIPESHTWPKYGLESMQLYNDTIYTLLIKENVLTSIPLHKKERENKIGSQKINLPIKCSPLTMARNKGEWYFLTQMNGILILDENYNYRNFIAKRQKYLFEDFVFINDQIIVFNSFNAMNLFSLYDLNGKLLNSSKENLYVFMYPYLYENIIRDGYNEIRVENNMIKVSDRYDPSNYGNYNFVGGCQNMGFFVERDNRNEFVIRDLRDKSVKARFFIPVKFSDTDLGIPEEDSFNLRVFSQDNETFYFVTIKHKHLLIYKAVR